MSTKMNTENHTPVVTMRLHPEFLDIIEAVRVKMEDKKTFNYKKATRTDAIQELLRLGVSHYVEKYGDPRAKAGRPKKEK